jgi:ABC-2 type transport system ATP-binding protein
MSIIEIKDLEKTYQVYQKKEGLRSSLRGLFKREYKQVKAVQGIDLQIEQGEFVAFLGPNGAGKTTTLKLLSGVIHPTSGTATVMGHIPWLRENEYRRRFALVMGNKNQLWWDLPAQESFRLHQQIYRIEADVFQNTLDELTELLDIRDLLEQPVRELSLGQRMKMELTAALLHSPEVLFLDEPTIGLDVVAQHNIQQFLKYYQQKRKITILLTSHYMKDVAALCKRVVIIADGLIKYDGSLDGIIESTDQRKLITLQFRDAIDDSLLAALKKFGNVTDVQTPRIKLTVARDVVPRMLSSILDGYQVDDVIVEDPPLEDVIAAVFSEVTAGRVQQIDDDEFESIGDGQGL